MLILTIQNIALSSEALETVLLIPPLPPGKLYYGYYAAVEIVSVGFPSPKIHPHFQQIGACTED